MGHYERKDSFYVQAKREGFRSRAAYKLAEIDARHRLLRRGARVVDLGSWPGGWLQVAAAAVGPEGRVVGVDRDRLDPLPEPQVVVLQADLGEPALAARILAALGRPADLVLCDAAPKLTGVRDIDRAREEELLRTVEDLVGKLLRPGGDLLVKILECPEARAVEERVASCFQRAKAVQPAASRPRSSEHYLLGRGLKDVQKGKSAPVGTRGASLNMNNPNEQGASQ